MRPIVRRVRAMLVLAALWGAASGALGLAIGLGVGVQRSRYPVFPDVGQWWFEWGGLVLAFASSWAAGGAVIALGFAALLGRAERGRDAAKLSSARVALWGGLAGGALYTAWWLAVRWLRPPATVRPIFPIVSLVTAILFGAACAGLTLWLSRRAGASPPRSAALPSGELPPPARAAGTRARAT